jgi:hypothetical protein
MYNPTAYWQSGGDLTASSLSRYFALNNINTGVTYSFNGTTYKVDTPIGSNINEGLNTASYLEVVQDLSSEQSFNQPFTSTTFGGITSYWVGPKLAGQPFFASATGSGLNNYQYDGQGEAWYMDVTYIGGESVPGGNCTDLGTYYFYYVNQDGIIINDTLNYGETKRIISQTAALYFYVDGPTGLNNPNWITWTYVSRYTGNVTPYPYRDKAANYTLTVKRVTGRNTTTCATLNYTYVNYTYIPTGSLGVNSLSGAYSQSSAQVTTLNTQFNVSSYSIPLMVAEDRGGIGDLQASFPNLWCTVSEIPPTPPPPIVPTGSGCMSSSYSGLVGQVYYTTALTSSYIGSGTTITNLYPGVTGSSEEYDATLFGTYNSASIAWDGELRFNPAPTDPFDVSYGTWFFLAKINTGSIQRELLGNSSNLRHIGINSSGQFKIQGGVYEATSSLNLSSVSNYNTQYKVYVWERTSPSSSQFRIEDDNFVTTYPTQIGGLPYTFLTGMNQLMVNVGSTKAIVGYNIDTSGSALTRMSTFNIQQIALNIKSGSNVC